MNELNLNGMNEKKILKELSVLYDSLYNIESLTVYNKEIVKIKTELEAFLFQNNLKAELNQKTQKFKVTKRTL